MRPCVSAAAYLGCAADEMPCAPCVACFADPNGRLVIVSWEPTLNVVEASQDPACKKFPEWNGIHGEPGELCCCHTPRLPPNVMTPPCAVPIDCPPAYGIFFLCTFISVCACLWQVSVASGVLARPHTSAGNRRWPMARHLDEQHDACWG